MPTMRILAISAALVAAVSVGAATGPNDSDARTEMKRVDLSGAPDMEVISSVSEFPPGAEVRRHLHHGVETGYVLQGARIQYPGKDPVLLATGSPILNLRDVPHSGFKVVDDHPLKLFTVHIVDKAKPLYDWVP
jgi:quercetin dioxygenase-like cupin family protein